MKKSKVLSLNRLWRSITKFFAVMGDDKVTVFSAQASYFFILSSVPFLILLLSLAKYVIDIDWLISLVEGYISGNLGDLLNVVIKEVLGKGNIPLVSATVVTTMWTTSRGVSSLTRGISEIYGIRYRESFIIDMLRAFLYTIAFLVILLAVMIALMFAGTIKAALGDNFPIISVVIAIIKDSSQIVFTVLLTLFFALFYNAVSKKGKRSAKDKYSDFTDTLPRGYFNQLPGAVFSALGWVLFSYFFSLYLEYFPTGYYIYGSLAAALLLLLWLYTCMMIFLIGAELNKIIFRKRSHISII